eukprot:TRINITY_DN26024_c0_g1_i1.p1 TRINITY_DN26024_c0_g1~~TRINITY_DN26024_c0_g1_i1.p1  ORF type:complete len:305 (-),score=21.64 TRINITY_DN26024_c0_g1_i1:33-947(-)
MMNCPVESDPSIYVLLEILDYSRLVLSLLWCLFSSFSMFSMFMMGNLRLMAHRLNFVIIMVLWVASIGHILSFGKSDTVCMVQAIFLQFSMIAQFCWIPISAINLFVVFLRGESPSHLEVIYHLIVWFLSSLITSISYRFGGLSVRYTPHRWCWFQCYLSLPYYVYLIPNGISFLLVALFHTLIWRRCKNVMRDVNSLSRIMTESVTTKQLIFYPPFLLSYILPFLGSALSSNRETPKALAAACLSLEYVLFPLLGIVTTYEYGFGEVFRFWKTKFRRTDTFRVSTQEVVWEETPLHTSWSAPD